LGVWSMEESLTSVRFTGDSNWIAETNKMGDALFTHPNKYRTRIQRVKEYYDQDFPKEEFFDTVVNGKKRHIMITDSNGTRPKVKVTYHKKKVPDYTSHVMVSGKIIMKRHIVLKRSSLQEDKAYSMSPKAPTGYIETKKEMKKRTRKGMRVFERYKSPYPKYITAHFTYESLGTRWKYSILIFLPKYY
jgi:hypothetical protein